jgi:transposase
MTGRSTGLLTITGVNLTVAAGLVAAIGDIGRFKSPHKLVSYFGLNPRVRQSGLGLPIMAASARWAWIPERSATRLREADLNVLSKLGK